MDKSRSRAATGHSTRKNYREKIWNAVQSCVVFAVRKSRVIIQTIPDLGFKLFEYPLYTLNISPQLAKALEGLKSFPTENKVSLKACFAE